MNLGKISIYIHTRAHHQASFFHTLTASSLLFVFLSTNYLCVPLTGFYASHKEAATRIRDYYESEYTPGKQKRISIHDKGTHWHESGIYAVRVRAKVIMKPVDSLSVVADEQGLWCVLVSVPL